MVKKLHPRVGMLIPQESKCGVVTYSNFLLDEIKGQKKFPVEAVINTCGSDLECYRALAQRMENEFDLIHVQFEFARFGKKFVSGIGARNFFGALSGKIPVITTLHDLPESPNPIVRIAQTHFLAKVMEKSSQVLVHTTHSSTKLSSMYPTHASKIRIMPHGMFVPATTPAKKKVPVPLKGKTVIGFFGFLSPHKNVELVLDAIAKLPPNYVALIAGEGQTPVQRTYEESLRQHVHELGIADRVYWEGFVLDARLGEVFSWMDIVVFPYHKVTESGALHLALANKKIIFASRLPAFEELANAHSCIRIFSGTDDLVTQIQEIIVSPAARKEMLANIPKLVSQRSWKAVAAQHIQLYHDLTTTAKVHA